MKKKRLLEVSKYYYPYNGGIEQVCQNLCECLSNAFEIKVICFSESNRTYTQKVNGIEVEKVGVQKTIMSQAIAIGYYFKLKKIIKEFKPDIIHFHWPNIFVAWLLIGIIPKHTKLVVLWHSDILKQKWAYYLVRPIEKKLLKKADLITPTSPNYLLNSTPLSKHMDKCDVLPNAIDTSLFKINSKTKERIAEIKREAKGKTIIFFIGRLVEYKGVEDLLKAEKFIKNNCIIFIAGRGPLENQLRSSVHSARIKFIGRISDEEKKCYYYAADIFAFPSINKAEAFGITLAEAMYCRAVPITFHIEGSGVNWLSIKNETGIEIPLHDIKAYANAIDYLIENKVEREKLANNAHQRIINYFTIGQQKKVAIAQFNKLFD